jgi:hypothetical protein
MQMRCQRVFFCSDANPADDRDAGGITRDAGTPGSVFASALACGDISEDGGGMIRGGRVRLTFRIGPRRGGGKCGKIWG